MSGYLLFLGMITYLGIGLIYGAEIYFWGLKFFGDRKLKELDLSVEDLDFSFEQIDYLVATPSINYQLDLDSIYIKQIKDTVFGPKINALQVAIKLGSDQEKRLAIVNLDKFPVPILDMLFYNKKINQHEYNMLTSYLFSHPKTHELIVKEVKTRIKQG
ncbi:hypothetical protein JCM16358_24830 [Halanaerocella petrolearia]